MADDVLITAGMLADKLRPFACGKATEADVDPAALTPIELPDEDVILLGVHPATIGAIYQHLERLAQYDGEVTQGHREWSAWDQAVYDGKWHPHRTLDGRYQAIRCVDEGERKTMEFDAIDHHPMDRAASEKIGVFFAEVEQCSARCAELNS